MAITITHDDTNDAYTLNIDSGKYVGLASNVARWIEYGELDIDERIFEIWSDDDTPDFQKTAKHQALPLIAKAIHVADCDGPLYMQQKRVDEALTQ